jgi:ribosomal protein S18 acetylase RimI-like enzyme
MNDLYKAFHHAERNFFSLLSLDQMNSENLEAFATGVLAANLNPAIVKKIDAHFLHNLIACKTFYAEKKLPWVLILPEYLYDYSVAQLLSRHALSAIEKGVAMATLIQNIASPAKESALTIREMEGDLSNWSIPLIHAFESTDAITSVYAARHQLAAQSHKTLHHFSGFISDTIVCSLSLSLHENYARIDDVATMPAYQKKGYATSLIYAALNYAQQLNATICFLEASADGLSLYKQIGFHSLFTNCYYQIT